MASGIVNQPNVNTSANGYCKLPDGTMIQWGELQNQTETSVTVNFTHNFVTNRPSVIVSSGAGEARFPVYSETVTMSSFKIYTNRGSNTAPIWLRWVAIGRWK